MKRLMFNSKSGLNEWNDYYPTYIKETDFGVSCVLQNCSVPEKVRINNQEVTTGKSRIALYTMPNGEDTGVRYSPMYEFMGSDITELEANKRLLQQAKEYASDMIKEEFDKISTDTTDKISQKSKTNDSNTSSGNSE